jgi:murein DD-endopeptidase MepM/ murein hydrolase activator NlpD
MPPPRVTNSNAVTTTPTAAADLPTYPVKSGDTLAAIASRMGVSVEALKNANSGRYPNITNERALQIGWQLTVPAGGHAPGDAAPTPDRNRTSGWQPQRSNDRVTFVAINNSDEHRSTYEAQALKNRGVSMDLVKPGEPDKITVKQGGRDVTFDLKTIEGARGFALTLGLPGEQTEKIAQAIAGPPGETGYNTRDNIRDEMAQLAQVWAKGERGEEMPSRLVLSGHHTGSGVYGDNNGKLAWPFLEQLASAMPKASRNVEDLMIAGCFSGGQADMEKYQTMFPNVKTIVAYHGLSPGASSGATAHQKAWEQATRGTRQDIDLHRFEGMRWGDHVSVWTQAHGLQDGEPPQSLDQLRTTQQNLRTTYDAAFKGDEPVGDTATGPVRQFYAATQRLIQSPDLPASERAALTEQKDQSIRLIFYPNVAKRFGETYQLKIEQGFQAVGMTPPDFKTLSRKDALAAIAEFQGKLNASSPAAAQRLAPILNDFAQLKPALIPDQWV